ncbi:hypothetical protein [Streptomyces sp. MBT65]
MARADQSSEKAAPIHQHSDDNRQQEVAADPDDPLSGTNPARDE